MRSASLIVFACHEASCAPPPTGTGGSRKAGSSKAGANVAAEHDPVGYARAVARRKASEKAHLDSRTRAAEVAFEKDMEAEYREAQARGDIRTMTKAAVEWAGVRADIAHPGRTKPDISDKLAGWFMGPPNKKGRQQGIIVPRSVADAWRSAHPPTKPDTRRRVTKTH